MGHRPIIGALVAFLVLIILQTLLVRVAQRRSKQIKAAYRPGFMDLIVTSEDGNYSLSRLQMYLWTYAAIIGYVAVFMWDMKIPDIPESLYILMGVNFAATAASTAINTTRKEVTNDTTKDKPDFVKDIFFESDTSLDLPRSQMFVWTIVSLGVFFVLLCQSFNQPIPAGTPSLPDIPTGLIVLMGISHGAYLGVKGATIKKENEAAVLKKTDDKTYQATPPTK